VAGGGPHTNKEDSLQFIINHNARQKMAFFLLIMKWPLINRKTTKDVVGISFDGPFLEPPIFKPTYIHMF
jgi:hypothetical protein